MDKQFKRLPNPTLIRVFEIPSPDERYCHGGGKPMNFQEVDWFHDISQSGTTDEANEEGSIFYERGRENLTEFIKEKMYYDPDKAYLVLCPLFSFTIGYDAN